MEDDVNIYFNKFLNIYLRTFHSCFIKKRKNTNTVSKPWKMKGIKTSCNPRRELHLTARDSNAMEHNYIINSIAKYYLKFYRKQKKYITKILLTNLKKDENHMAYYT